MWRKVLAAVLFAAGSFLLAVLFVVVDSGRSGLSTGAFVVAVVLVGLVPAGLLLATWLLLRRANRVPEPTLSWVPANGMWLDQRYWAELPDPLPSRPRKGRRPLPTTGVPPDEMLRRLWAIQAELAHDRRRLLGWLSIAGWLGMVAIAPLAIFALLMVLVMVQFYGDGKDIGGALLLLDWSVCLLVTSWLGFVGPLRRHVELVRQEAEQAGDSCGSRH